MPQARFSKKEAIKFGWVTAKKNFWFFFGLLVVVIVVSGVSSSLQVYLNQLSNRNPLVVGILNLLVWLVNVIIGMGLIKISLNFVDNKTSKFTNLLYTKSLLIYIATSIIVGIATGIGFVLLIIPGIILAIKLQFASYLIIDKGFGIKESIKKSWAMTKGEVWNLFLFGLLLILINLAGVIALVVGLLLTVPLTMVAGAYVYRKLL